MEISVSTMALEAGVKIEFPFEIFELLTTIVSPG